MPYRVGGRSLPQLPLGQRRGHHGHVSHHRDNRQRHTTFHTWGQFTGMHHWGQWEGPEEPEGLNQTFSWWMKRYTHHPITLLHQVTSQPKVHVSGLSEEPGEHGEHTRAQIVTEPELLSKDGSKHCTTAPLRTSFLWSLKRKTGTLVLSLMLVCSMSL